MLTNTKREISRELGVGWVRTTDLKKPINPMRAWDLEVIISRQLKQELTRC